MKPRFTIRLKAFPHSPKLSRRAERDRQGRSLRDFDLKRRLFKYPLSYMIYSEAFDAMPDTAKDRVYRRLFEVLSGEDKSEKLANFPWTIGPTSSPSSATRSRICLPTGAVDTARRTQYF